MRNDLLDALAAIDWADAQVPLFRQALSAWENEHPHAVVMEPDPDFRGGYLLVAIQHEPLPLTFNAWAGAVINSLRSSLDLLAAALAVRNGVRPNSDRHFPVFETELDMIDPLAPGLHSAESKKWLSDADISAIKALKPYKGGDHTIWPLHKLDIIRKHERLITGMPVLNSIVLPQDVRRADMGVRADSGDGKTVLARLPRHPITKGNVHVSIDIRFDEAAAGLVDAQAIPVLRRFVYRVREIVNLFDA